ncbi:MAG: molybdenum cofactor biosynthesis protein MoaB [Anaerolineales bacterium]|nr:molybdenum cofactor biosynthesis protein MoaB [Anaerolineales bacterium]
MRQPSEDHKKIADETYQSVVLGIITVSDSRTEETDTNGIYFNEQIIASQNLLGYYKVIKDEPDQVLQALREAVSSSVQIILFNGGTGISRRDTTFDVLSKIYEKILPGFGEIFRMLSYQKIGSPAMFSRASAGTYQGCVVISTPGSPAAVKLAWEKLILPELKHLAWEMDR